MEQASAVATEVTSSIVRLKLEVEEKKRAISLLQTALVGGSAPPARWGAKEQSPQHPFPGAEALERGARRCGLGFPSILQQGQVLRCPPSSQGSCGAVGCWVMQWFWFLLAWEGSSRSFPILWALFMLPRGLETTSAGAWAALSVELC